MINNFGLNGQNYQLGTKLNLKPAEQEEIVNPEEVKLPTPEEENNLNALPVATSWGDATTAQFLANKGIVLNSNNSTSSKAEQAPSTENPDIITIDGQTFEIGEIEEFAQKELFAGSGKGGFWSKLWSGFKKVIMPVINFATGNWIGGISGIISALRSLF